MNWLDPNILPWLIPIPPLVAFAVILLAAGRSRILSQIIAIFCMALSWLMSVNVVWTVITQHKDLGMTNVFQSAVPWLVNGSSGAGSGALNTGVMIDPLTTIMLFMVPLACLLIFIYTIGYMAHDPRMTRFFAYLSLFASGMLTLVVADNLLMLFIGWEVMGLCSYLLIGFWYEKPSAYKAAIKAFMTTRVGDVIMTLGIAYLWASTGTLNFRTILHDDSVLHALATTPALGGFLALTAAGLIGLCIVAGTIGKSAQFPLHVWLPDAMEGPTPVSAMIHAATMVSAGVYLVIRMYPLLSAGANVEAGMLSAPMTLMAVIGAFTAIFSATIAISQNDIKKVLAYSTISQLGFMIAALGIGAYVAAAFHLITHAFFKALLFLGSGSVIHGMEHGEHAAHSAHEGHGAHDEHPVSANAGAHDAHGHEVETHEHPQHDPAPAFDPQDMRNMGGLGQKMPVTMWTFIIGGAALAGFPLVTAGFWSKDEIFADAFNMSKVSPTAIFVLVCLALAAILTAMYTYRQIAMTFWGKPRTEAAANALHNDGTPEGRTISFTLTAPLVVLAFFAIFAGYVGVNPGFPVFGSLVHGITGLDEPFANFVGRTLLEAPPHLGFSWWPVLISFSVFILGVAGGYVLYTARETVLGQIDPVEGILGSDLYRILQNKYYVDEFYVRAFIEPTRWVAETLVSQIIDQGIIDGILAFVARAAVFVGNLFREFNRVVIDGVGDGIPEAIVDAARGLRMVQSGHIQQYLLYALIAVLLVGLNLVVLVVFPNAIFWAAIIQVAIALVILALIFLNTSGSRASS